MSSKEHVGSIELQLKVGKRTRKAGGRDWKEGRREGREGDGTGRREGEKGGKAQHSR